MNVPPAFIDVSWIEEQTQPQCAESLSSVSASMEEAEGEGSFSTGSTVDTTTGSLGTLSPCDKEGARWYNAQQRTLHYQHRGRQSFQYVTDPGLITMPIPDFSMPFNVITLVRKLQLLLELLY
jgi:hypothetical protein